MDPSQTQELLLCISRRIHRLENERDELDQRLADAKREHLELLRSLAGAMIVAPPATSPNGVSEAIASAALPSGMIGALPAPVHGVNGTTGALSPILPNAEAPAGKVRAAWQADGLTVKARIARFVAAHAGPVTQATIIEAMGTAGVSPQTAEQACYDLTSSKVGWLDRTAAGLLLNAAGKEALKAQ